ncbi:hypothetical protein HPB49_007539 [Dermacentor silvarum]|uniref:Uncharacterized protein n=1 Tax=Dermacentor silvarum TaxID=543639 RepID=A0ACB8DWR9_DERSI|nr:hypothetical protein HPB49_007539 [Dermacentor silvarum]
MGDRLKELADIKCVIRALLVVNNGPTRYTSLLKQYQAQEGRGIPYRRFGYADCISFLESLTDTVHVTRNDTNVLLSAKIGDDLCHVQTLVRAQKVRERCPTTTSPPAKVRERPSAPQLPELVERNLLHLVGENGANLRALRDVYFRRFGTSLEVEQYGFASLEDCLARLQIRSPAEKELEDRRLQDEIVATLQQYPEGLYMSHFAEASERLLGKPVPVATLQLVQRFPSLFRVERCGPTGDFVLFPAADVASPQSLPPAAPLPSQSLVLVSHVRSPTEIAVQQQSDMLIELTIAMNRFYGVPDLLGKIPNTPTRPLDASPGRLCAAFWDKSWLRVRIAAHIVGNFTAEVDLIDSGERRCIERHYLRALAPRFAVVPPQCTVIQLDMPAGVRAWGKSAGERLRALAKDRWLTCHVCGGEETPPRAQLVDDHGKSLSTQLDAEGLCERTWRYVQLTSTFGLNVVRLETRRYIFSVDLSRLLGWSGDKASQELERRGIHFEQVQLRRGRDEDSWRAVATLMDEGANSVCLFPAANIVDAVNMLGYPLIELSAEMRRRLSQLSEDW